MSITATTPTASNAKEPTSTRGRVRTTRSGLKRRQGCAAVSTITIAILLAATPAAAQGPEPVLPTSVTIHSRFDELLSRFVHDGRVDYAGLHRDNSALADYLVTLESVSPAAFTAWSSKDRLAFWINAYNAHTIRWIVDHFPTEGIWQTTSLWRRAMGGPFGVDFIALGKLAGPEFDAKISLNDIENEVLRKYFHEPRIHFALVCASTSCPKLRSKAYVGPRLDEQLSDNARDFMQDTRKNRYKANSGVLQVSEIFKWFSTDFAAGGGPRGFFVKYGPADKAAALKTAATPTTVEYLTYDWSLND